MYGVGRKNGKKPGNHQRKKRSVRAVGGGKTIGPERKKRGPGDSVGGRVIR